MVSPIPGPCAHVLSLLGSPSGHVLMPRWSHRLPVLQLRTLTESLTYYASQDSTSLLQTLVTMLCARLRFARISSIPANMIHVVISTLGLFL